MTTLSKDVDSAQWWECVCTRTDVAIGELVDGFAEIAGQAIPYAWLPGRARTFYGADFTTWSDLAGETIDTLVNRPKGGIGTVRAIAIAAREAVATVRATQDDEPLDAVTTISRLLDRLTAYDHGLLSARVWALNPLTIPATAHKLGATQVNVQRATPRAYRRLQDLLADPAHAAVSDYAEQLRQRLGPLTRENTAARALRDLGLDLASDAGQLLLHVAGPYTRRGAWLELADTDALRCAAERLDETVTRRGAPTTAALTDELATLGIPTDTATDVIAHHEGLRRFGDHWVRWGDSIADKIEAALHLSGVPASAPLIAATIDCLEKSVRVALWDDPRFHRATKQTWALRRWNVDEYHGVYSEIAARIDAAGGAVSVQAVVDAIMTAFPDVAESSVRTYTSAPGFITDNGMVRRRTKRDGWPAVPPLNAIRGAFHNGRQEIRIALPVTSDTLRGSGQTVHSGVATALGIHPGEQRTFTGKAGGDITVFWRLAATSGGSVGSLRGLATRLGAELGDTLVLIFNIHDGTVRATRIPADEHPSQRLRALLGKPVRNPHADLARSLRCRPEDAIALLRRRGDDDLIALIDTVQL